MARDLTVGESQGDPLKTVADALESAAQAVKDGAIHAKESGERILPGASDFMARLFYTSSYALAYGVVFPTVLVARSIPANNPVVQGFADGAHAARDVVAEMKAGHVKVEAAAPRVRAVATKVKPKRKASSSRAKGPRS